MAIISLKTFKNEDKLNEFPEYDPERELEMDELKDNGIKEGYDCPIHGRKVK